MTAPMASGALAGRAGVVTGGGRGIGAGMCAALLAAGAGVVDLERSAGPEASAHPRYVRSRGDAGERLDIRRAVGTCVETFGRIDFLVANAGVVTAAPLLDLTDDEWDEVLRVNLTGVFRAIQEAARVIIGAGRPGSIVVTSSINAWWAEPRTAHYNASKAGLLGLVRSAARELAPQQVRVNAVAPGMVQTPLTARLTAGSPEADRRVGHIPIGRYGQPSDIGAVTRFLVSDESSFVTGACVTVDGGQTLGLDFAIPPAVDEGPR